MEAKNVDPQNMETLGRLIKSGFPVEKVEVSLENTRLDIYLNKEVTGTAAQVKAIHHYGKGFVTGHGDPGEEYVFRIYRERELIDILNFNDPHAAYYITMDLFCKVQSLRVQDVLGMSGDYTIFNEDFERIGWISPVSTPPTKLDGTLAGPDDMDGFYGNVYPDFSNQSIWQASPELRPYLPEILSKVLEQINLNIKPDEVNVDDPEDVTFWAAQFEISEADLKKAVLAAGKSIDDITAYLQE